MCIIAIKERNQNLWTTEEIKKMMERNPDGAGFMFPENGKVRIIKGLMTVDSVMKEFKNIKNVDSLPIVFHARISTSGGVKKGLTHPFALNREKFLSEDSTTNIGMVHNGTINVKIQNKDYNDTVTFIDTEILPFLEIGIDLDDIIKWMESSDIRKLTNYSRFVFMDGEGNIKKIGNFVKDTQNRVYSNDSYKGKTYFYPTRAYASSYYDSYYDDYYDYDGNDNSLDLSYEEYRAYLKKKEENAKAIKIKKETDWASGIDYIGILCSSKNISMIKIAKNGETEMIIPSKKYPYTFVTPSGRVFVAKEIFNFADGEVYEGKTKLTTHDLYEEIEDSLC